MVVSITACFQSTFAPAVAVLCVVDEEDAASNQHAFAYGRSLNDNAHYQHALATAVTVIWLANKMLPLFSRPRQLNTKLLLSLLSLIVDTCSCNDRTVVDKEDVASVGGSLLVVMASITLLPTTTC